MKERMQSRTHRRVRLALLSVVAIAVTYLLVAYMLLPALWTHYERQRGLAGLPMVTRTADDLPGDPLNIGIVGSHDEILRAMHDAGWIPADPITLRSSIRIIGSVVADRPYRAAPVSPLFYDGRREDLAFEKPAGKSADRRHHVRYWLVLDEGSDGRPVWLGSATFDRKVGLSRYTGQVTHHIAPDIDDERDTLADDLGSARVVAVTYDVSGIGPTLFGRNGGGDPYHTDGEIRMLVLTPHARPQAAAPRHLPSPPLIELKNGLWHAVGD